MRNLRALLSYDGSKFFGWQRQAGFWSVQEALEQAIEAVSGEAVTVHGAGRTDAGVHALRQVASFHLETTLTDDRLRHALNAHLGEGALVERLEQSLGTVPVVSGIDDHRRVVSDCFDSYRPRQSRDRCTR